MDYFILSIIIPACCVGAIISMIYYRMGLSIANGFKSALPFAGFIGLVLIVPILGVSTFVPSNNSYQSANQTLADYFNIFAGKVFNENGALFLFVCIIAFYVTRKLIYWNEIVEEKIDERRSPSVKRKKIMKRHKKHLES